jgi:hypothetical protein
MLINKDFDLKKKKYPFPYIKIDNFFTKNIIEDLQKNYPSYSDFHNNNSSVGRMDGDTTSGNPVYEHFLNKCNSFKSIHKWVYSMEFYSFFLDLFKEDLIDEFKNGSLKVNFQEEYNFFSKPYEVSEILGIRNFEKKKDKFFFYPRLDVGYGKKNYGLFNGGSGPHIDNPQRLISILIFLGGYESLEGGEHRIYEKKNNNLQIFESYKPITNRIIASVQNNFAFHDVNPIKKIKGQRNALYLAISSNKKIWNDCEKNSLNKKYNVNRYNYTKYENFINTYKKKIKFYIHKLTK